MQPSDFLTILGLGLAIWSFIPKKERSFILLFFSNAELIIFNVTIFIILFLMSFDWLKEFWFGWLSVFTVNNGILATIWAFIVSLVLIAFPILKVSFSYFSASRLQNLIALYKTLLRGNEIDLLVSYINKYHIADIQNFLIGFSHLPEKGNMDLILRSRTEFDEAYEKLVKPKRIKFAVEVYRQIIQNELFIRNAASIYPELFADIFKGMESKMAAKQDLVKLYIESIFETRNHSLIKELKKVNESNSSIKERDEYVDLPILTGLLVNTEVAVENYVWYPVMKGAMKSLKHDKIQKEFLIQEYDSELETELWDHKIWIATVYFNYMVRETIYRDGGWHMWLYYFRSSTDHLIEIIPLVHNYLNTQAYPSFAHYIIYQQFDIMLEWIELAKEQKTDNRVIDTISCLGSCLHLVCQADEIKLSRYFKKQLLNNIVNLYLKYAYHPNNIACITTREWLKKLFLNPNGVDFGLPEITPEYLSLLEEVWVEYDRIQYTAHGKGYILDDFENDILQRMGIIL